eukprot:5448500-Alexandrium_andersonii.AAC.1
MECLRGGVGFLVPAKTRRAPARPCATTHLPSWASRWRVRLRSSARNAATSRATVRPGPRLSLIHI